MPMAPPPIDAAAEATASAFTSMSASRAPRAASPRAVLRPRPLAAPVITTTFPLMASATAPSPLAPSFKPDLGRFFINESVHY